MEIVRIRRKAFGRDERGVQHVFRNRTDLLVDHLPFAAAQSGDFLEADELRTLELEEDQVERRVLRELGDERIGRIAAQLGDALLGLRRKFGVGCEPIQSPPKSLSKLSLSLRS